MKRRLLLCALFALCAALAGCGSAAANRGAPDAPNVQTTPDVQPARAAEEPEEYPKDITEDFVREGPLTLNGYEVSARARESGTTYAVLKRKGRVVAKFDDGGDSGFGVATAFGAFPFLGGGARQLGVSLTLPRYGRHWVVDLSSARPRVIFDSGDYGVGREDLRVIDLDKDGTYEIYLLVTAFYMFENMGMSETPLPEIVFKYDAKARRYLPANQLFPGYALRRVDRDIKALKPDNTTYMSDRLGILLRYVYAGRERDGWDFFDRAYERDDRDALKKKIASELRNEPVYRFLYRATAKR